MNSPVLPSSFSVGFHHVFVPFLRPKKPLRIPRFWPNTLLLLLWDDGSEEDLRAAQELHRKWEPWDALNDVGPPSGLCWFMSLCWFMNPMNTYEYYRYIINIYKPYLS